MNEERPGFLSRWSRRKNEARAQEAAPQPVAPPEAAPLPATDAPVPPALAQTPAAPAAPADAEAPAPLTLDDVAALTKESDYSLFVKREVTPEVRNAAMKKLFSDPHFNVMDGLDIYIDDYSNPEVMPQSMLRELASARVLNLFTEDEVAGAPAPTGVPADARPSLAADSGDAHAAADIPDVVDSATPQDLTPATDPAPSQATPPTQDSVAPAAEPHPSGKA